MATEERFILNSFSDTTGLGQVLAGFGRVSYVLPSNTQYIPRHLWQRMLDASLITLTFSFTRTGPRTLLETIIDDLERLERRSSYLFRPSKHAMRSARFYIFETYAKMGGAFPRPLFVLDG